MKKRRSRVTAAAVERVTAATAERVTAEEDIMETTHPFISGFVLAG